MQDEIPPRRGGKDTETMRRGDAALRLAAGLSLLALLLLLLPMLALGRYAVPAADDYNYGAAAHDAFMQSGSVLRAVEAAASETAVTYTGWQGSFSAVFLMALHPGVFGERLYALTPAVMLAALGLGVFSLTLTLYTGVFGMERSRALLVAAALCVLCTQLLPSPVQGFFWYNGSVYYVVFYGLWLTAAALAIRYVRSGGTGRLCLLLLLAALLGGGNYVTALGCAVTALTALALPGLPRRSRLRLLLPTLVFLAAFAASILAPGNALRALSLSMNGKGGPGAVRAVGLSFRACLQWLRVWLTLPLAGTLLCLGALMLPTAARSDFAFPCPGLVTLWSYCLLSAMFCPSLYATGQVGELRLVNVIFFAFAFLAAGNVFYWLGWAARRFPRLKALPRRFLLPGLALVLAVCCGLYVLRGGSLTSLGSLGAMRSGEAQAFRACADRRLVILNDENVRDAELEPFPSQPYQLYVSDIELDPDTWTNVVMSRYYHKNTVRLAP